MAIPSPHADLSFRIQKMPPRFNVEAFEAQLPALRTGTYTYCQSEQGEHSRLCPALLCRLYPHRDRSHWKILVLRCSVRP